MKKLLVILFLLLLIRMPGSFVQASIQNVSGVVYDSISGYVVPNQKVYFYHGDTGFFQLDSVVTAQGGIYSYDYFVNDSLQTVLKVFTYGCDSLKYEHSFTNPSTFEVVDFTICYLSPTPNCLASFTYTQDNLYPRKVYFNNTSIGLINNWLWDFGDSTFSTEMHPIHTYIQPGNYQVKLSAGNTMNPIYTCADTDTIVINPMWILGGQIMANFFPIQGQAKVILYRIIAQDYIAIDTSIVDNQGVYYFYQIPQGAYSLRAIPTGSELTSKYFPTYFQQSVTWQNSLPTNLNDTLYTNSFTLLPKPVSSGGNGFVMGNVGYTNLTTTVPAFQLEMMVFNANMEPLNYTFTAANGGYQIGGLAEGNYYLHAEIPGIVTQDFPFTIGNAGQDTVVMNLVFLNNTIGISEITDDINISEVFPNPAASNCTIIMQSERNLTGKMNVTDLTGRNMQTIPFHVIRGKNEINIDLSSYNSGIYFVILDFGTSKRECRKIVHFVM